MGILVASLVRSAGGVLCVQAAAIGLLLSATVSASATITYEYTGGGFTTFTNGYKSTDHVTASFALQDPIPANVTSLDLLGSFSGVTLVSPLTMSDGVQSLVTSLGFDRCFGFLVCGRLIVSTDAMGRITSWDADAAQSEPPGFASAVFTMNVPPDVANVTDGGSNAGPVCFLPCGSGSNQGMPGTWTVTPEPGTATLLAAGLVAMAGLTRRRV